MSDYTDLAGLQDYIKNYPSVVELAQLYERKAIFTELLIKQREANKTIRAQVEFNELLLLLIRIKNRREGVPIIIDEHQDVKWERKLKYIAEVKKCIRAENDETWPLEKCENSLAKLLLGVDSLPKVKVVCLDDLTE